MTAFIHSMIFSMASIFTYIILKKIYGRFSHSSTRAKLKESIKHEAELGRFAEKLREGIGVIRKMNGGAETFSEQDMIVIATVAYNYALHNAEKAVDEAVTGKE